MSAFGCKADMAVCGCLLSRSLLGVKRTLRQFGPLKPLAVLMPAYDPKRRSTHVAKPVPSPYKSIRLSHYKFVASGMGMKRRVTVGKARQGKTPNLKRRRTAAVARSRA